MGYGVNTSRYTDRRWPGVITWKLASGATGHKELDNALGIWATATGIRFSHIPSDNTAEADFVVASPAESTCWWNKSDAPRVGKPMAGKVGQLSLKSNATLGVVLHEIGHLLGLSHEHDRPDYRETYYKGKQGAEAFGLQTASNNETYLSKYGEHDAKSIMHYPESNYAAATTPSPGDIAAVKTINGWS